MTDRRTGYDPDRDFLRVRDFLNETYATFPGPFNWGLERWNYARYFVAPMLGGYGAEGDGQESGLAAIARWEELVELWEDEDSRLVGVACIEHPDPSHRSFGEFHVQRHPDHVALLDDMVSFAERRYAHPQSHRVYTWVYDDDDDLIGILGARGYERRDEPVSHHLEYVFGELPALALPDGFRLLSMAEECDIDRRREVFGRAFNHTDPREWPSAFAYRELQNAPDYQKEHDLFVVAADGTYAACCIVWFDPVNRIGHLEPLGTHPDYRRIGLATQLQFEGMRRLQALGATRMPMTGGFEPFYRAVGFEERRAQHPWVKQL